MLDDIDLKRINVRLEIYTKYYYIIFLNLGDKHLITLYLAKYKNV